MTDRYCIFVIPAAHRAAANLLMALVNGDDPALSNSFSRGANADGSFNSEANLYEMATHFFGGMPITEEWESEVSNLAATHPTPSGGWPWNGITEQDAIDAAGEIYLQVSITQNGTPPDPWLTQSNAMSNLGLVPINPPD
ncbi:hypothetical protein [uncultured Devosia sp.]|uniref:hypothetical protein n=1 Tax=uncultured Devosia sp. TaxID=211434 RepID=UPI00261ECBCE|nr:hypothetical protein [uncultured Devosia sp.]